MGTRQDSRRVESTDLSTESHRGTGGRRCGLALTGRSGATFAMPVARPLSCVAIGHSLRSHRSAGRENRKSRGRSFTYHRNGVKQKIGKDNYRNPRPARAPCGVVGAAVSRPTPQVHGTAPLDGTGAAGRIAPGAIEGHGPTQHKSARGGDLRCGGEERSDGRRRAFVNVRRPHVERHG